MIDIDLSDLFIYRRSTQNKNHNLSPDMELSYDSKKRNKLLELQKNCNENLQYGIIFSADFLFESLGKYFLHSDFKKLNKKERQTYKSLLEYYTRATYNATPFNLFTEVGVLEFGENKGGQTDTKLAIEMNMFVIKHVLDFLKNNFSKFDLLKLELNPSITNENGVLFYYHPNMGDITFSNIKSNAFIEFLLETFRSSASIPFKELISSTQKIFENDIAEIENIYEYFVQQGLLNINVEFNFLSSKNRLSDLIKFVKSLVDNSNDLGKLVEVLIEIETLIAKKKSLPSPEVLNNELNLVHQSFKEVMLKLASNVGVEQYHFPFKKYNLIYVDQFGPKRFAHFDQDFVKRQLVHIEKLLWKFQVFDDDVIKRKSLFDFYKNHYQNQEKVNFREFYVRYHQDQKSNNQDYENHKSELSQIQNDYSMKIKKYLSGLIPNKENNVQIIVDEIPSSESIYPDYLDMKSSHSVYFSLSKDHKFYLQSISTGFGRAESRFLLGLDKEYGEEIKRLNIDFFNPGVVFENNDFSFFNANFHSELADFEIEVQKNHSYFNNTGKLNVNNLFLSLRKERIVLENESGKEVTPINISLQAEEQRSLLFNFISTFNYQKKIDLSIINKLWTEINIEKSKGLGVIEVPALLVEEDLILFSKFWIIRYKINEIYDLGSPDNERFHQFMEFLKSNNIPYMGYIQFEDEVRFSEPFYYDVSNPLYFELFEKNAAGKEIIVFHEDLSSSEKTENYITTYYSKNQ